MRVPVYILAGGKSRRFGSDKARALLGGVPLLSRVAQALTPFTVSLTVVSDRADRYADLGLRTIADDGSNAGPLLGLKTAFDELSRTHPAEDWLLLTACDLPVIEPHWLEALLRADRATAKAVAFRHANGYWEPLLTLYHRAHAGFAQELLRRRDLPILRLLDLGPTRALPIPADWPERSCVNTKPDMEHWEERLKERR